MAGHSKWANIKRKKETVDKKRGNIFAKLSRAITMAVVEGGGATNPDFNVRLRIAVEKAKSENMPKDTIQRAIEKGAGPNGEALSTVVYEGFGPHGSSIIIVATTDNPNRTNADIRNVVEKNGGKMGGQGAVSYLFQHGAVTVFEPGTYSEDAIFEFADSVEAIDVREEEGSMVVFFPFEHIGKVKEHQVEEFYRPVAPIELETEAMEDTLEHFVEAIEELDDVQTVYTNVSYRIV